MRSRTAPKVKQIYAVCLFVLGLLQLHASSDLYSAADAGPVKKLRSEQEVTGMHLKVHLVLIDRCRDGCVSLGVLDFCRRRRRSRW